MNNVDLAERKGNRGCGGSFFPDSRSVAFPCMSSSSRMFSAATTALSTNTRLKQERLEWLLLLSIYAQAVYDEQSDNRKPYQHVSLAEVSINLRPLPPSHPHLLHPWAKLPQQKSTKDFGNGEGGLRISHSSELQGTWSITNFTLRP
jgi:hypothetical protein